MIRDRFIALVDRKLPRKGAFTELEKMTGISARKWGHIYGKRQNLTEDQISALGEHFQPYVLWLITGKTNPEAGQISPEIEEISDSLKKTGTDTE